MDGFLVLQKARKSGIVKSTAEAPATTFDDPEEAEEFFGVDPLGYGGAYMDWWRTLSIDEQTALRMYTTQLYYSINYFLREGAEEYIDAFRRGDNMDLRQSDDGRGSELGLTDDPDENAAILEATTKNILRALRNFRLRNNIVVWRGGDAALVGGATTVAEVNALKGAIVQDKGVISTAVTKRGAWNMSGKGRVGYEIEIPKGKGRGCYIDPMSENPGEEEFMITPGTKFRVEGGYTDGWGRVICKLKAVY